MIMNIKNNYYTSHLCNYSVIDTVEIFYRKKNSFHLSNGRIAHQNVENRIEYSEKKVKNIY